MCGIGRPCRNGYERLHDSRTSLRRTAASSRHLQRPDARAGSRAWDFARTASRLDGGRICTAAHASHGSSSARARAKLCLDQRLL
jgi:hypothetical protein